MRKGRAGRSFLWMKKEEKRPGIQSLPLPQQIEMLELFMSNIRSSMQLLHKQYTQYERLKMSLEMQEREYATHGTYQKWADDTRD